MMISSIFDRFASLLSRRRPAENEDARLARLAEEITPRREELRELRAKLPPSSINYDEEGDQPF